MRPKEWLVKNGHLPAGSENARGRISASNIELIKAAVAEGVSIEGYSVSKPMASTDKPVTVSRTAETTGVIENPEETVPERYNIAMVGNEVIGNRTVCDVCRRSLNYHICSSPRVMYNGVQSVVTFKPRPNPEKFQNRWW